MTMSYKESVNDRIKFMASIGKIHVALSVVFLLASLIFLGLEHGELHAETITLLAIPLLVSGAFLHILPSYNRKAPAQMVTLSTLAVLPVLLIEPRLYLLSHLSLMLVITLYSVLPFSSTHYYQKILALSSYTSALLSTLLFRSVEDLSLTLLYTLAVGMIFAVNTTALTFTYGQKPRGKISIPLSLLHVATPFLYLLDKTLFQVAAIVEILLYIYLIRLDNATVWLKYIERFKERSKNIHINLIVSSVISVILYPLWIPALQNLKLSIHMLAFGFIALNVAAHGPVLIPLAFRIKTKPPSLLLPLLFALAALTKALVPIVKTASIYSCMFFAVATGLLAYYTIISRES